MASRRPRLIALRGYLPPVGSAKAFAIALLLTAIAIALRMALQDVRPAMPPYITIFPAIVLASFIGGMRAGAFATIVGGVIASQLWVTPPYSRSLDIGAVVTVAGLAVASAITIAASGLARLLLDEVSALEAARALAARETIHRIKNLIAVVHAISYKIASETSDRESYFTLFDRRLQALATAQDILVRSDWRPDDLKTTLETALAPFLPNPRLTLAAGPDARTPAALVSGLCLALHELATNAMKYGALSADNGSVLLSWRLEHGQCILSWRETGLAINKTEEGFGSQLIRSALAALPDAAVEYRIEADQVLCEFCWPLAEG